jgi:hypothetical protein
MRDIGQCRSDSAATAVTDARRRAVDTGQAMVLVCLIAFLVTGVRAWALGATACIVVTMVIPRVFAPVAVVWFGASHALGTVVSKVLLTIIYYVLVTPVGLLRRVLGRDPLLRRRWKDGGGSVFVQRDHTFTAADVDRPY